MCKALEKLLKKRAWSYRVKELTSGNLAIDTNVKSDSGVFKGYDVRLLLKKWDMTAIIYIPLSVPAELRKEAAAYLARINWNTRFGKHLIDFVDGEMRTEIVFLSSSVENDTDDVMHISMHLLIETIDEYARGLVGVVSGCVSAEEAFTAARAAIEAKEKAGSDDPPPVPPAEPAPAAPEGAAAPEPEGLDLPPELQHALEAAAEKATSKKDAKTAKKSTKKGKKASAKADNYSLEGLNLVTPVPLADIVKAVRRFRDGSSRPDVDSPRLNILLSGAPGSGKTAFVKYLAREVGAPLKTLKASDLISRYSGETEQRIAEAFEEAKETGAILFLDEVDSFLQDRKGASHSWEVTQVNELLQQMEEFEGVMVGATNFAENLDKAVLRRFTYKIQLNYLTDEGKGVFFERYFKTPLTEAEAARLKAIRNLTPGDFRTVREELFYLDDKQSNDARLAALEAESAAKGSESAPIGF